jgi:CRISPR-associated endonuclease/helicase Cas3
MLREAWMKLLHGSLSGELVSHKGKKLYDHLAGAAKLALEILQEHGLKEFEPGVLLAAYTHDLGKAHPDFQKHVKYGGKGVEHSAPSSFFTLSMAGEAEGLSMFDIFLSMEAVRRHHTHIDNWDVISSHWSCQYKSLEKIRKDMNSLIPKWPRSIDQDLWDDLLENTLFDVIPDEGEMFDDWLKLRATLSLLVAGDRMDAIGLCQSRFFDLPRHREFIFPKRGNKMDEWRAYVADICAQNSIKINEPGIYTLTLPTGAGKTNIGLKTAHTIARNLGYRTIIYALPFISIVEQNADFAKRVFDQSAVQEDHSLMLMKSTDEGEKGGYGSNDGKDENWDRLSRLFRYWISPVVVTTMAQLWEAIYSPRASATIDFHRLSRAVVILDEPQGISSHLWRDFGKTMEYISKKWKTAFILMTATQPEIALGVELAPKVEFPFARHRYKFLPEKHALPDLPDILREHVHLPGKSGLVVLNTRRSALEVFRLLEKMVENAPIYMLSRWMSPNHRRETINKIKEHQKAGELHYLVSTQVVEAGVDLDFDWVFRDLGPLDSIIQVAGRCNRSASRDEGTVVIAELFESRENGSSKPFADMVYDSVTLNLTRDLLNGRGEFGDGDVREIVSYYYKELSSRLKPCEIWKRIGRGEWGDYTPLFKNDYGDVPVYVDRDGTLDDLFEELRGMNKALENREFLKSIRNKLEQYAIGVSKKYLTAWSDNVGNFVTDENEKLEFVGDDYCVIRPSGIGCGNEHIYHPVAGFQPIPQTSADDNW